ncbi:unnamed protein product [Closterium sp. NIES-53]
MGALDGGARGPTVRQGPVVEAAAGAAAEPAAAVAVATAVAAATAAVATTSAAATGAAATTAIAATVADAATGAATTTAAVAAAAATGAAATAAAAAAAAAIATSKWHASMGPVKAAVYQRVRLRAALAALHAAPSGPLAAPAALLAAPCGPLTAPCSCLPCALRCPASPRSACCATMASLQMLGFDHKGRPLQFDTWLDDLQLYLLRDSRDSVSLFDHTSGAAPAPPATADSATRSQWLTRNAAARLAICNHLQLAECAHFGQHRTTHALYDAVVARYSSPATAALGRLLLPYLFPELSAFATVEDLRRIGLVMEVARTSMIHVGAPHFLWSFEVRYAVHQLNLWPLWCSCAFVRDSSADKLSARAIPCVFLGFPHDAPGWQFYHPTSRRVFPSQDITFDESVPFYRLFPYRSAPPRPPPLFLTPARDLGAARGTASGGAEPGGAESEGAGSGPALRQPVYGLRKAPCEWHDTLRTTLVALGFAPSTADPLLFLHTDTSLLLFYILGYVDDLVFATADSEALTLVKSELQKRHTYTDLEPSGPYPKLVGCLMYLMTCTRPDLAYPLRLLARYVAPGSHRKGYTFSLGSGSVSWRSTRSSSVLSSSCEAEIYAGAMAAQELRWLTYLLNDLGEQPCSPPILYVDNKAMIALCQEH